MGYLHLYNASLHNFRILMGKEACAIGENATTEMDNIGSWWTDYLDFIYVLLDTRGDI